jgi:DNA-binding transcriptional LysR family regulator
MTRSGTLPSFTPVECTAASDPRPAGHLRTALNVHQLNEALRRAGVDPVLLDVALVLPSNEPAAAEAGAGVAALSELVVAPALAAGTLAALPFNFGPRPFYGLRHKERYRSKAADALLNLISDRAEGRVLL